MADSRHSRDNRSHSSGRGFRGNGQRDQGRGRPSFGKGGKGGRYDRGGRDDRNSRDGGKGKSKEKVHQRAYQSDDPNEPEIPAGVLATDLDEDAQKALLTLSGSNREIVARHLVAAGQLIDIDAEQAYLHAQAAVKRAGRVDLVREAAGLTAYATGRYEEALRELRAVRRMRGGLGLIAVEADCERGLGRPQKAIDLLDENNQAALSIDDQVEVVLVAAGARMDLGQDSYALMIIEKAVQELPEDASDEARRRLMAMQARLLSEAGRQAEAEEVEESMPEEVDPMEIVDLGSLVDADVDNTRTDLRGGNAPLPQMFDGALLDLDGVCFHGKDVYAPGPKALQDAEDQGMLLGFITNNASRSPEEVAEHMNGMGYDVVPGQVMTSALELIMLLEEELEPGSTVLVIGTESFEKIVKEAGYHVIREATEPAAAVLQAFAPNVGWAQLTEAAYAIQGGAKYYATNLDATLPTERGLALGNGALSAALSRATSTRAIAAGKPQPQIFQRTAKLLDITKALVVGDRLDTDIAGAVYARMASMAVLGGASSALDIVHAKPGMRPAYVALGVEGITQVHPRPLHHTDGTWTCGVSQAVRIGPRGRVEIADSIIPEDMEELCITLDTFRALIAAAWEYATDRRRAACPPLKVVDNDDPNGVVQPIAPAASEADSDGIGDKADD